jgi:hypothetical protein
MSFLGEIRRRKVFQVAAVYAVVSWLAVGFLVINQFLLDDDVGAPAQASAVVSDSPSVTRFRVVPPAAAPLTSFGGYDIETSPDGSRLAWFGRSVDTGQIGHHVREIDELDVRLIAGAEYLGPV